MQFLTTVLGVPLGYIMYVGYLITSSYGLAILFFSLATKIICFPLSMSAQKNSIRLLQLQPKLNDIKRRYAGEKNKINEEQYELFQKEKYSPFKGLIPLLVQLILIIGIVNVIYNPLSHLLHIDANIIAALNDVTQKILGVPNLGVAAQLHIVGAVNNPENLAAFTASLPNAQNVFQQIGQLDLHFLSLDLSVVPSLTSPSILLIFPFLSGLSSLILCLVQNKINPAQQGQGFLSKWGMTIFLVAFSIYFPLVMPAGVGLYWFFSNAVGIFVALLLNVIYNPKKLVPAEALMPQAPAPKLSREEKAENKRTATALKLREKEDYAKFKDDTSQKQLVFFSVSSGQYKYFQNIIDYVLANSDIIIHYVTNDENDQIFKKNHPQIIPYYIGGQKSISLMMKIDADMVAMTVPDLQKYHIKRSIVRDDIEYLYIFHTVASMHMTLREGAVDYYDTVFCVGPHQLEEIRKTEEIYGLPNKRLVKCGYSVIDQLMEAYKLMPPKQTEKQQVLIAPSWQADNILDSCIDEIITQLHGKGYRLIVRPHPEYIKRFPERMNEILEKYEKEASDDLVFELDFSTNASIYQSDILMTDWSNIAFEFSYCTKKPSLFINTEMKVMNPEYKKLGIEPLDVTLRNKIGVSVNPENLNTLNEVVSNMLLNKTKYQAVIEETVNEYLYYPGRSGEAGGRYILSRLQK